MTFDDLGLSPEVLSAINDAGYVAPTPIQELAIPFVLMGRDVLGCAQTGTGKTASFTLPMIEILSAGRSRARMARSLILTPTRELATQIADNFEIYGKYQKLSMALLIGGVSFEEQNSKLDRGVDVLIATPGRLLDHFERGRILLTDIKILVIDEADRMMDMGFMPDVEKIVMLLPPIRQTLFFSATIPSEIRKLANKFLIHPKEITVSPKVATAETVEQFLTIVEDKDYIKRDALRKMIVSESVENAIIFCNRKRDVDILNRSLQKHGFNSSALHGNMSQPARLETLEIFKKGETTLLVASDVAARGLDIPKVSHVFNFDVPIHAEDYIHRIGRTGRAGRKGRALTIGTNNDGKFLDAVYKVIGQTISPITFDGIKKTDIQSEGSKLKRKKRTNKKNNGTSRGKKQISTKNLSSRPHNNKKTTEPGPEKISKKPDRDDKVDENNVVGMGSHVPKFMLKSNVNKND
ncbi:MAG: DEAD/DEAH box helicase [Pseudomonadota bacterium]|nr:DEAD/DEAH box helicase [Pseudomonadota bacterium]